MPAKIINFTAIVVTYNEDRLLEDCLRSLRFCNQIIVADLGSTDDSIDIAKELGAEILRIKRMPIVEQIHQKVIKHSNNDWVVLLDPDEIMPEKIDSLLREIISTNPNLGRICIPWQFYFKGTPLTCTIWGNKNSTKPVILHKSRNFFSGKVHRGTHLINDFSSVVLLRKHHNYIKHYWINSYKELFKKHWRYIGKEGESRYFRGERFSIRTLINGIFNAIKHNLITYNGFRSFTGIALSFFYTWYILMSLLSLRKYQKSVGDESKTTLTQQ